MSEFFKEGQERMDPMDIGSYQESIRINFRTLEEMYKKNFNRLNLEKLEQFRSGVSDLIELLKTREDRRK